MLTKNKVTRLMHGQSALAQKIYELVPIREAWPINQIYARLKSRPGLHVVTACIGDLKDAGLIKDMGNNFYQRIEVRGNETKEVEMQPGHTPVELPQKAEPVKKPTSLDILAGLAGEVKAISKYVTQRIEDISARMEEVALVIEREREESGAAAAKLRQLQSLLKGIDE